ncbi:F-box associated domain containing protein [Tanacetum coccineum]
MGITENYYRIAPASIFYGFGVRLHTKEYKVIRIFQRSNPVTTDPHISEAEVYTFGTGQWRRLGHVPYWIPGSTGGTSLNGCAHWVVRDHDTPEKLCSFNFDKETFQLFPSPPSDKLAGDIRYGTLGILHGFLSLTDNSLYKFNIWVMKDYGIKNSWHKEVVIMESINPNINWPMRDSVYLLEALEDGTILMSFEDKLFVYCPRKKTIEGGVFSKISLAGLSYRPSFVKLQTFESERVQVIGGTINEKWCLLIKATHVGSETALSQIVQIVEAAQLAHTPVQKLADRISKFFVPVVSGVVAGVVTLVRMVRSRSGWNLPKKSGHSNYGLVALGKGASEGVLIKGGNALEKAHKVFRACGVSVAAYYRVLLDVQ